MGLVTEIALKFPSLYNMQRTDSVQSNVIHETYIV